MLKMCPRALSTPLKILFDRCLIEGSFPAIWKRANVQPVHKKESKQSKTHYRPISLLPICSKIFEKIIFDQMYKFLNSNNLISQNQSGFRPGDSTINQLLSITTEIYQAFENYEETRAVFLDISKAFDKVWHEGLIFKLKQNGINGTLINLIYSFLSNRKQRVVLNGYESDWEDVRSGVPQGSVLGPLLFLVYINDLTDNISSNMRLFADDSSLFAIVENTHETHEKLCNDLSTISAWAYQWKMQFNPDISKQAIEVIFSHKIKKPDHPLLVFNGIPVARKDSTKHLGLILDERLSFRLHIKEALQKAKKGLGLLKYMSRHVSRDVLDTMYKMYIRPHLDYADVIFHGQIQESMDLLESIQYQAARIITGCWQGTSRVKLYNELGWESLHERRRYRRLSLYYKINSNMTPNYLKLHINNSPLGHTNRYSQSFFPYCASEWNLLSESTKFSPSLSIFKSALIKEIRPTPKKTFSIKDNHGMSLITRLRVEFSDLRDHRFRHSFNCASDTCKCDLETETTEHFLLRCPRFSLPRVCLLNTIGETLEVPDIVFAPDDKLCRIMLFGSEDHSDDINNTLLNTTIRFIRATKRFDKIEAYENII